MRKTILFLMLVLSLLPVFLQAEDAKPKRTWKEYFSQRKERSSAPRETGSDEANPDGMLDLVDSPTANIIDYGAFRLNERLYSKGGVQNHLSFGVFRRLNIGVTWDVEKFIGQEDPNANPPTLNVRFRVYDGGQQLPAVSIGYDGQGRFYNKNSDQYRERERGLYGIMTREVLLPNLRAHGGVNIAKFREGEVFGSLGLDYTIENKLVLLTEYDNIRKASENRFNAGFRVFATPSLALDFAVRHITEKDLRERIVRINYVGSF